LPPPFPFSPVDDAPNWDALREQRAEKQARILARTDPRSRIECRECGKRIPGYFPEQEITWPNRVRSLALAVPHVCQPLHVEEGSDNMDDAPITGVYGIDDPNRPEDLDP
jgi:hypothetical protein